MFARTRTAVLICLILGAAIAQAQTWKKVNIGSSSGAPTISLTAPPTTWLRSSSSFSITATYSSSVSTASIILSPSYISVSGTGVSCTVTVSGTTGYTRTINVSACSGESSSVQLVIAPGSATSAGGVIAEGAQSVPFKVDNTAPSAWNPSIVTSGFGSGGGTGAVSFSLPTDSGSGIASYAANFIGVGGLIATTTTPTFNGSGSSISAQFANVSCGRSATVDLTVYDFAGNSTTVNRTVFIAGACD